MVEVRERCDSVSQTFLYSLWSINGWHWSAPLSKGLRHPGQLQIDSVQTSGHLQTMCLDITPGSQIQGGVKPPQC